PGLPGWGAKSTATVLAYYGTIERIPDAGSEWEVSVRGGPMLAAALAAHRDEAMLFKDLATLRVDRTLLADVEQLRWQGPTAAFAEVCARLDAAPLARRADKLAPHR
ncbi:MAG TPA: flap endonuclease, partial [Acidimicrobiales bacterium]|nr:flap endonuclease [Acidimicrobiales bacterium]